MQDNLNQEIGVFKRREVEARILKPFLDELAKHIDQETLEAILAETVRKAARELGGVMRQAADEESIEAFAAGWEPWFRGGALEIDELEKVSTYGALMLCAAAMQSFIRR
ncbi:MAG: L-2-amino-thiazoline-4-carboxylic acid hydrolase [Deinococcales bacterium]